MAFQILWRSLEIPSGDPLNPCIPRPFRIGMDPDTRPCLTAPVHSKHGYIGRWRSHPYVGKLLLNSPTDNGVTVVILVPIGFFIILIGCAVVYRRYRSQRGTQSLSRLSISHSDRLTSNPTAVNYQSEMSIDPEADCSRSYRTHSESSFTEPHFEEKQISIRRISNGKQETDVIQSINSVTSTLNASSDPSSDHLPYGGRKSSIASLSTGHSSISSKNGVLNARQPSTTFGAGEGIIAVRRVSAGGGEDVLHVREASVSSDSPRDARFASVHDIRTQLSDRPLPIPPSGSAMPLAAPSPLKTPGPPRKPLHRPDSIRLTSARLPITVIAHPEPVIPTSMHAVNTPQTTESIGGIFEAWRGFPKATKAIIANPPVSVEGSISGRTESFSTAQTTIIPSGEPVVLNREEVQPTHHQIPFTRTSDASRRSVGKITYLADVVAQNTMGRTTGLAVDPARPESLVELSPRTSTILDQGGVPTGLAF